ncbi:hypothetical protein HK099_000279 [Clydaea vesicula]|uniref:Uncharacterized protein n=1 Tax=Clydaea vesicula TaxID=447962 RepID=A0AAD5U5X6_9FUNG|nr:hypothetical protein HK099_000279 [Clydaea vesicula]
MSNFVPTSFNKFVPGQSNVPAFTPSSGAPGFTPSSGVPAFNPPSKAPGQSFNLRPDEGSKPPTSSVGQRPPFTPSGVPGFNPPNLASFNPGRTSGGNVSQHSGFNPIKAPGATSTPHSGFNAPSGAPGFVPAVPSKFTPGQQKATPASSSGPAKPKAAPSASSSTATSVAIIELTKALTHQFTERTKLEDARYAEQCKWENNRQEQANYHAGALNAVLEKLDIQNASLNGIHEQLYESNKLFERFCNIAAEYVAKNNQVVETPPEHEVANLEQKFADMSHSAAPSIDEVVEEFPAVEELQEEELQEEDEE